MSTADPTADEVPITLPDLRTRGESARVSCWLVNLNDTVDAGDRLVEIILPGVTFDVSSPASGILCRIEKRFDHRVEAGDVLGWIRKP